MNYQELKAGETLQLNDEYSAAHNQEWKSIPDFMISSKIPDCPTTHWRRPLVSNPYSSNTDKKSFFKALISAFKKS